MPLLKISAQTLPRTRKLQQSAEGKILNSIKMELSKMCFRISDTFKNYMAFVQNINILSSFLFFDIHFRTII